MGLTITFIFILTIIAFLSFVMFPATGLLIALGAGIYGLITGFSSFTPNHLLWFLILGILISWLDELFALLGAKKFGASKWGIWGAIAGMLGVLVLPGYGAILGPLVGAFVGEHFIANRDKKASLKASFGALIGLFTGAFAKGLMCIGLVIWFAFIVL